LFFKDFLFQSWVDIITIDVRGFERYIK